MAALGQLIAGIAHEINNPLGAITTSQARKYKYAISKKWESFTTKPQGEGTGL